MAADNSKEEKNGKNGKVCGCVQSTTKTSKDQRAILDRVIMREQRKHTE